MPKQGYNYGITKILWLIDRYVPFSVAVAPKNRPAG